MTRPTLPGHWGGPHLRRRDTNLDAFADGLEALLDDLGGRPAHIAGNSIGGWLALELARRGRARSVVAIAPAGGWTRFSPAPAAGRAEVPADRAVGVPRPGQRRPGAALCRPGCSGPC